jgi:hypothetical protein
MNHKSPRFHSARAGGRRSGGLRGWPKALSLRLAAVSIGLGLPLVAAESVLRFLPVQTGLRAVAVNAENPIFRFTPNRPYTYSKGWSFDIVNHGRVNNAGFVNDQDYVAEARSPLLAVIGDSYVEAVMVPYRETLHGRLAGRVAPAGRVYSFAASGAPLSQYLVWARHARETYRNDALIIVVIGNDFDESLAEYRKGPGFHHYWPGDGGALELRRVDFEPNRFLRMVAGTSLGSYLVLNLQAGARLRNLFATLGLPFPIARAAPRYVGNTEAPAAQQRIADSEAAVAAFIRDLPGHAGLPPERILFVVDGLRYPPADAAAEAAARASYFGIMRARFIAAARRRGYEAIDMDEHLMPHYRRHEQRFEWPTDGHWNRLAHGIAADAVARSRVFRSVFGAAD